MEQGATPLRVSFRVGSEPGVRLGVSKPLCAGKAGGGGGVSHSVVIESGVDPPLGGCDGHAPFQGLRGVILRSSDGSPERQV